MKKNISLLLFIVLFVSLLFSDQIQAQNRKIDSLFTLLKKNKEDTNKLNLLNEISRQLRTTGHSDSALNYANEAKSLAEIILASDANKNANKEQIAAIKEQEALAMTNMGVIYRNRGNYPAAMKYFLACLKIREEAGNALAVANSKINIGNLYKNQNDLKEALRFYEEALRIFVQVGDQYKIALAYNNIGNVHKAKKDLPLALNNYIKALKIFEKLKDDYGLTNCYNNIGVVYEAQGDLDRSLENHFASAKIAEKTEDLLDLATSYGNIGPVLARQKKFAEARSYLNKSLQLSKKIKDRYCIQNAYYAFAEMDSMIGNFKSSFDNYKLFILYRDSLVNEENTKKTVQAQMQYDFDKEQAEDSIKTAEQATQENIKHEQEIKQQKIYTYGGALGFLLMLVVAGVSYNAFRQKQKANEIIQMQKEIVEDKQKEILDSIHYARRIQQSLLPTTKYITNSLRRLNEK